MDVNWPSWIMAGMAVVNVAVLAIGGAVLKWLIRQEAGALVAKVADKVERLEDRVLVAETELEKVPTAQALHELALKLERVATALEGHKDMQAEILHLVRRHEMIIARAAERPHAS